MTIRVEALVRLWLSVMTSAIERHKTAWTAFVETVDSLNKRRGRARGKRGGNQVVVQFEFLSLTGPPTSHWPDVRRYFLGCFRFMMRF
jgi:hypothetical protein